MRPVRTIRATVALLFGLLILIQSVETDCSAEAAMDPPPIEITVLYDNYKLCQECRTDWGFSCMITGTEKNILFDAGTYGNILLENMDRLGVDARDAELMVISHNHGDHTGDWQPAGGVLSFLARKSNLPIYLPPSVPAGPIQTLEAAGASPQIVNEPMPLCEDVHLTGPMTGAAIEQSLVLETRKGLVVITGCAHPGIVAIVTKAKQMLGKDVYLVLGGFHLPTHSDAQIHEIIRQFRELGVQKAGASHCTGDRAIKLFRQAYGQDFVPIGVGRISIPTTCDFTGDWKVDIDDLVMLIEHWGQAEASLDVAPPLFGDGIVDVRDLEVLMSHWGQEIIDPSLLAHWKLDETDGDVAYDSAGANDATLVGDPQWQPGTGVIDGALELDGIDDYVEADALRDPSEGPFSVFVWVRGGLPGQVILSQKAGADWLLAGSAGGNLTTNLKGTGRKAQGLSSQAAIIDGQWHRIGLTWDGSNRILYVDDVEVARDTQSELAGSFTGLNIGCGANLEAGSFFSGPIDDVRIYNRAVRR